MIFPCGGFSVLVGLHPEKQMMKNQAEKSNGKKISNMPKY
jgi:hypothetical protein|tara:strand:+ start:373 stop:492 length:120 start_codon:yes stop_codon:yes gene_type:complete